MGIHESVFGAVPTARRREVDAGNRPAKVYSDRRLRDTVAVRNCHAFMAAGLVAVVTGEAAAAQAPPLCATQVAEQRLAWGVTGMPHVQPPAATDATLLHWATSTLGTWVVELRGAHDVSLRRVADGHVTHVVWSTDCVPSSSETPGPSLGAERFTDTDLRRLVAEQPRGLLYVWSPHMPLSIEGVALARMLAEGRGLPLTVLLDPAANETLARSIAETHGWPPTTTIVADSTELRFRDVLVHAPTLQAYAGGRLVGSALPGHHTNDEYSAYLDRVFAATP